MRETNIKSFINIPLKAEITKTQDKEEYTIHIQKHGNCHRGISVKLTEDQIRQLEYWY